MLTAPSPWVRVRPTRFRALCLSVALATFGSTALAQADGELTRARAMFQQAVELEQAGNCSSALPLFRQVGELRMTPQVRFHIAFCEEKLGRLVTALGGYELALAEADSVGSAFRAEVQASMQRVSERIPKLLIQRGAGAEAASIQLDGVALGSRSIGVAVPMDPGPHDLVAEARGYKRFQQTVTLEEGENESVEIVLEPLPQAPAGAAGFVAQPTPKRNLVPYIVGGVGVASLVTSGIFLALRQGTLGELEDNCTGNVCPLSQQDEYDRAKTYNVGALITFGVGVAAVGTGAALLVVGNKQRSEQPATAITWRPTITTRQAGASVTLKF